MKFDMMCRYPMMSEKDFEEACPICKGNCNCINCLRKKGPSRVGFFKSLQFLLRSHVIRKCLCSTKSSYAICDDCVGFEIRFHAQYR